MSGSVATPRASMYVYPWDVADQGAARLSDEVRALGIDTLSIASSYHAGRFVQPRGKTHRTYFPEDGTVYFRPNPALWQGGEIVPKMAAQVENDGNMLAKLATRADAGGLGLACWTVCLHNTRLGMLHPGHVTRNAYGDANYFSLCPSSPAARRYARTLVADLTAQFRPEAVEIETPGFMGFAHGYHHEKDGVGLTPEEEFLLSICFCEHCQTAAKAKGLDPAGAAEAVVKIVGAAFEREVPARTVEAFPGAGVAAFAGMPALFDYVNWRTGVVTSLVEEIRAEADPATKVLVISEIESWREGIDLKQVASAGDGVGLLGYGFSVDGLGVKIAEAKAAIGGDKALGVALRPFIPDVKNAAELADYSVSAVRNGATRLHYYNYGLVPARRLAWVATALEAVRR